MTAVRDGWLEAGVADARIRWWLHGEGDDTLMVLHGGPGAGTPYLEPLRALAGDGVQVLLYDQLGSGRSDRPDDPSLWTMDRSVAEVDHVRTALGLGRVHLLGQSFGGFLALDYVLTHPAAVRSLVLSNTAASVPEVVRHMSRLRAELDPGRYATMLRHEAAGTLEDEEYASVVADLYSRIFAAAIRSTRCARAPSTTRRSRRCSPTSALRTPRCGATTSSWPPAT